MDGGKVEMIDDGEWMGEVGAQASASFLFGTSCYVEALVLGVGAESITHAWRREMMEVTNRAVLCLGKA